MAFPADERAQLLAVRGVGPTVVARLEQLGYSRLSQLAAGSADDIVGRIAAMLGTTCWRNSPQARAAIIAAISAARTQPPPNASSKKPSIIR